MNLTTKDIIKVLPFEDQFRKDLLDQFDVLTLEQKYNIERVLWDTYFALYKLKFEEKMNEALLRARENQESLDGNLAKRVEEEVIEELKQQKVEKVQETDLTAARKAMELIVKEIQASPKLK